MGIIHAFQEGGAMMYGILLLGIFMLAITYDRFNMLYFKMSLDKDKFYSELTSHLLKGDIKGMISVCEQNSAPLSKVIKGCLIQLLNSGNDENIQAALDEGALSEVPKIEKRILFLGVIGNIATLLGLLGTITGLIRSFGSVANTDAATKAAELTRGVSEAMNCTAFGLIVAVPAILFYSILQNRAQTLIDDINEISIKTLNFILANRKVFNIPTSAKEK